MEHGASSKNESVHLSVFVSRHALCIGVCE